MIVSGMSYSRLQAMEKIQKKTSSYRQQVDEILEHIALLLKIDPEYQLITQLQTLALNMLQLANNLSPQNIIISDNLRIQRQKLKYFKENTRDNQIIEFLESETELNQIKSQLGRIGKILDIYCNKGELSMDKSTTFHAHLKKINLELTINSHMNQAKKCGEENNVSMYKMHITQAREVIKKSALEENDKNRRIKELTAILNNVKRTNKIMLENTEEPTSE